MKRILCIGSVTADLLLRPVDALPVPGTLQGVESVTVYPGGCAVNAALDLQRLGGQVKLSCLVGKDTFAKTLCSHFEKEGLSTFGVVSREDVSTTVSVVLISSLGERSFLYLPGSAALFKKEDILPEVYDEADIVFVAGAMLLPSFEGEDLAAFMKKAREDGKMTVMDTAWDKDGKWLCRIKEALPFTDLFMPSFEEAKALSGESDPEKIADFFFDCGCGSVIIKLGKQGALLCEKRDQRMYVPIVEGVTVKDTTGAGDAFCAGFLYGISKGWSYERSGSFACAVSACCIEQTGASAGVCSAEKILERFGGSI
jgi:sugar/nucleoside kinase (ribokinase family)